MFALPMHQRSNLPQRSDSLGAAKAAAFTQIEDELRDVKRAHSQGQEEDLRMALSRTISRVEELILMLKEACKAQTDLQTELTLAKSNLQLALANNEMLEDALKRDGAAHSKDVGWRRWSAKEQRERELADPRRQSTESNASLPEYSAPSPAAPSPLPSTTEGRFFKFRFGNQSTPTAGSPRIVSPNPNSHPAAAHLTSASLPSLIPTRDQEKEMEELLAQLERERKAHKTAQAAKEQLEAELESLSQALFEEANKMVAAERMKLADTEEELKEAMAEKEALRSALKLVEHQRQEAESRSPSPLPSHTFASSSPSSAHHSHKRSSSSAIAVKSLPSSQPSSIPSSPRSMVRIVDEPASSSTRAPAPPPLNLPEVGLALDDATDSSPTDSDEAKESAEEEEAEPTAVEPTHRELLSPPEMSVTAASSIAHSPSPGQFGFTAGRPLSYFETEESPWADVRSSTPVTAAF